MIEQFGVSGRPLLRQPQVKYHWERQISCFLEKNNKPLVSIKIIIWFSQGALIKVAILKQAALIPSIRTDVGLPVSYLYNNRRI